MQNFASLITLASNILTAFYTKNNKKITKWGTYLIVPQDHERTRFAVVCAIVLNGHIHTKMVPVFENGDKYNFDGVTNTRGKVEAIVDKSMQDLLIHVNSRSATFGHIKEWFLLGEQFYEKKGINGYLAGRKMVLNSVAQLQKELEKSMLGHLLTVAPTP